MSAVGPAIKNDSYRHSMPLLGGRTVVQEARLLAGMGTGEGVESRPRLIYGIVYSITTRPHVGRVMVTWAPSNAF